MFGRRDLEKGEATIVDRHLKKGHGGSGQNDLWEWAADVTVPGNPPFRTVLEEPGLGLDFREPDQGDRVGVLVDPKTSQVKFDKSDPRLSLKAARAAKTDTFQQVMAEPAGSPLPGAAPGRPVVEVDGGVQVISAADAAPFLQDILSGDPAAKAAAIAGLQHRADPAGAVGAPAGQAPPGGDTVPARLAQLQQLKDAGAVDEAEFQAQRRRILDSL
jgi:hypothetical protein